MSSSDITAIVGSITAVNTRREQKTWADVEYILSTAGLGEKAIEEVQNNSNTFHYLKPSKPYSNTFHCTCESHCHFQA